MEKLGTGKMTETEMREMKCPWFKTIAELNDFLNKLSKENNGYGKAVYCMSLGATATFYYMSHVVGATGFQASCADMDILTRTRHLEMWSIVNYSKLLYPQYCTEEHFPTMDSIGREQAKWLSEKASKLLKESPDAHPNVIEHWKNLNRKPEDNLNKKEKENE